MQKAKRLLMFTALSVSEIGQLLGYDDPAHFRTEFSLDVGRIARKGSHRSRVKR